MKKTFKVAIVQENRDEFDCAYNTKMGLEFIRKAKQEQADIVLFPECWITGYKFPSVTNDLSIDEIIKLPQYKEWSSRALCDNSIYLQEFYKIAKELEIGIVITGFTKGDKRPQNSAFVINKQGKVILKYSKVHTCDFADEKMIESGNEFKVCEFEGVKLGVMICYDREYPESARILMLKGAELILVPNDCCTMQPRVQALSTRAYENMVGVVMANPPGENAGCSCAFSPIVWDKDGIPKDNVVILANDKNAGIYYAEYDLAELRDYREHEMMGNTFRKVGVYAELLNSEVKGPFLR